MRRKEAESSHHDKKRRRPARAQLHGRAVTRGGRRGEARGVRSSGGTLAVCGPRGSARLNGGGLRVCELLRHTGIHIAKALKGTCEEARQPAWTLPGTFHPAPSPRCLTFCNTHHFVLKQLSLKPRREGQTLFL